jgi:hypothetical protein
MASFFFAVFCSFAILSRSLSCSFSALVHLLFGATIAPGCWLVFVARVTGGLSTIFFGILSGGGL